MSSILSGWELVQGDVYKFRIEEGFLYRSGIGPMVFVPADHGVKHEWTQEDTDDQLQHELPGFITGNN